MQFEATLRPSVEWNFRFRNVSRSDGPRSLRGDWGLRSLVPSVPLWLNICRLS